MTRSKVELKTLTADDYEKYFGYKPKHTMRGVVGIRDGGIVGLGGVIFDPSPKAFMDLTDDGKTCPREIIRGTKMVIDIIKKHYTLIYAIAADKEVAPRFLEHFGFEFYRESESGSIYLWLKYK